MIPGEIIVAAGDIILNEGREATTLTVANTGDRPVQIGSHYHFAETNQAECGLILRLEPPFGLSPGKHGKFSLSRWLARGGSLVSMRR